MAAKRSAEAAGAGARGRLAWMPGTRGTSDTARHQSAAAVVATEGPGPPKVPQTRFLF